MTLRPRPDPALARRTVLKGARLGVGAGLLGGLTSAPAASDEPAAAQLLATPAPAAT